MRQRTLAGREEKDGGVRTVTSRFTIYKLDFRGSRWVEIKSLEDMALFLGNSSSTSVVASEF